MDGIFVGPGDLSAALGYLGAPNHPEVQRVMQHIFARVRAQGKSSGILAPAEADARHYLEWGARFVAVDSDLGNADHSALACYYEKLAHVVVQRQ